ncbi:MAG: hypothetical protein LBP89_03760 [Helicobacteraceae bacterium]|jgi:polyphosphate kinase 2 (PPK2 family)|nr:hypothetical protein [Helicobacteraceae bacterium]
MPRNAKPAAKTDENERAARSNKKAERYKDRLFALQTELAKLQKHIYESKSRLIAIVEGGELSGKNKTIRSLSERLDTSICSVVWQKERASNGKWFLAQFASRLPRKGEIAIFDRGWYGALNGEYERRIHQIPLFEQALIEEGFIILKFFLKVGKEELNARIEKQKSDPFERLRLNEAALKKYRQYDEYAKAEEEALSRTHTPYAPWFIVDADDKKEARLGVLATILTAIDYKGGDQKLLRAYEKAIAQSYAPKVKF